MNGYKTWTSGISLMAVGLIGLLLYFADPESKFAMDPNTAVATIVGGLGVLGIGHKIVKVGRGESDI
jgi:hypothetical protein